MSDNIKWGIRKRMREGKVCLNCTRFLGYDIDENGRLVVIESEAVIVRKIFELYLNGWGVRKIKKYLKENGIKTVTGKDVWSASTITGKSLISSYKNVLSQPQVRQNQNFSQALQDRHKINRRGIFQTSMWIIF